MQQPSDQPSQPASPRPSTSERPLGVTILAVLAAISGVVGLLASLRVIGIGGSVLAGGGVIFGLITLILSILYLVFAYGAWTLKAWAWTLGVGLTVASIALTVIQLVQRSTDLLGALISLVISGVILYYLFQPDVKAAFNRT